MKLEIQHNTTHNTTHNAQTTTTPPPCTRYKTAETNRNLHTSFKYLEGVLTNKCIKLTFRLKDPMDMTCVHTVKQNSFIRQQDQALQVPLLLILISVTSTKSPKGNLHPCLRVHWKKQKRWGRRIKKRKIPKHAVQVHATLA